MKKANLPVEKACEPKEEACQPVGKKTTMSDEVEKRKNMKAQKITFDEAATEKTCSQNSVNAYKEVLSQPSSGLSHRQKMEWLQKRRTEGLWVQCEDCDRWRFLSHVLDSHELPAKWYCHMNPDKEMAACSVPEAPLNVRDEEDLVHGEYAAGSVVWARLQGWPWWPAMVDDCPDTEQYYWLDGFSDIPTHYNVVFFDATDATRAWISPENLKPYAANKKSLKHLLKNKKIRDRLQTAMTQADDAVNLDVSSRLAKYSFIARFNGPICKPRKISKQVLKRHQKRLQKKFNIEFPIESSTESEDDEDNNAKKSKTIKRKNPNMILIGSPKRAMNDVSKVTTETPKRTISLTSKTVEDAMSELHETPNVQVQKPSKKLSILIEEAIDKLQDSLLDSSNASAIVNHSAGVKDSLIDSTQTTNIVVLETESQTATDTNDPTFNPHDDTRNLTSPSSDDFDF